MGLVFARALVRRGYDVEVVTGFPNYPGGTLYPGYRVRWLQREEVDGVRVTRVPLYPSHDARPVHRILNYVSFAASSLAYLLFVRRADVLYVYQLPTKAVAAAIVRRVRGIPFVLHVQDIWPDTLAASNMVRHRRVLGLVDRVVRWTYRQAAGVIAQSEGFRRLLIERGAPADRVSTVINWCDEQALARGSSASPSAGFPGPDRFRIIYAGNMGRLQALDAVLDAAERLRVTHPRITFVLMGGGVEEASLKARVAERGATNVVFLPRVPMEEVGGCIAAADAALVHLKRDPLFAITIPSKVQAYMAVGKPILVAVGGDADALVSRAGCGVSATPEDPESIAAAAIALASLSPDELRAMGERGKTYYDANLSVAAGVGHYVDALARATR